MRSPVKSAAHSCARSCRRGLLGLLVHKLSTLRVSEEARGGKPYTNITRQQSQESERDTGELCEACPSTQEASANIHAFPSAIVLQKQKLKDPSLERKTAAQRLPPSPSLPLPPNQAAAPLSHLSSALRAPCSRPADSSPT
ncbi:hypothetical protein Q8A73_011128 [Channa argus]|nr:hypothetical protein Q8A73_011128 [Channa argus]